VYGNRRREPAGLDGVICWHRCAHDRVFSARRLVEAGRAFAGDSFRREKY